MRSRTHTNPFKYFTRMTPINLDNIFSKPTPKIELEIGFGVGDFIRSYATTFPERSIIGVEVRKAVTLQAQKYQLNSPIPNLHLIHGYGQIVLEDCLPDHSIDRLFLFHPDPWLKDRHHKRRVINPTFLDSLSKKLDSNGKLYISTDCEPLWIDMVELITQDTRYCSTEDPSFWENYTTHWHRFSLKDNRTTFKGVFKLNT